MSFQLATAEVDPLAMCPLPAAAGRALIFLIVSHGWTVRNYVLGRFLPTLAGTCDVLLASPLAGDPEFESLCSPHARRTVPLVSCRRSWLHTRIATRRTLYHFAWCRTESMAIKKHRATSWYSPMANARNRADYWIAGRLAGPLTLRVLDRLDAWQWRRARGADHYRRLFDELRPALVVSTASVIQDEWLPIHVARERGIRTATTVMSWDNLSSKGRLPGGCDWYLAWTDRMKEEVLRLHPGVAPEQVIVGGTPQFDYHVDPSLRMSREQFCARLGLDSRRKIVVYAGVTPGLMPYEPDLVATLIDAIRARRIGGEPQVLIRLHPADDGARYQGFRERYPEAALFVPGREARGDVRRLVRSLDDVGWLVNTLVHGDVHLNVASTMTIDAAVLDRPVVNVAFDVRPDGAPVSPGVQVYDCTHYRPVVAAAGARMARSAEELVAHVNAYLTNPTLDREGRRRIVDSVCGRVDGRSGERLAGIVGDLAMRSRPAAADSVVAGGVTRR